MASVLPVRATTRSLLHRACPAPVEAAPTATVPVGPVPQLVPAVPVPVGPVPQPVRAVPVPQQVPVDPARVHRAPVVPAETVPLRA
ncbi:hypothetical protein FBY31_4268 [Arthrobacter sp. SLBN-100]|nr:hypothetical protein FBY31_4268 [Arthrobacter sp. SLBN-100]